DRVLLSLARYIDDRRCRMSQTVRKLERVRAQGNSVRWRALPEGAAGAARVPVLSREGISWKTRGNVVEVAVELVNRSPRATEPARMFVEAAPLGAFVKGVPFAAAIVGALQPGERRTVTFALDGTAIPWPNALGEWFVKKFGDRVGDRAIEVLASAEWA